MTMVIGICIGLILWATLILISIVNNPKGMRFDYPKIVLALIVFMVLFGAIGRLISGH